MELQEFIEKFADAIEIESVEKLSAETKFRDLDEWSSLSVLSTIAMLDEEYGIQIENSDFKVLNTIGDIAHYIEMRK